MKLSGVVVNSRDGGLIGTTSNQGEYGCLQVTRRHGEPRGVERRHPHCHAGGLLGTPRGGTGAGISCYPTTSCRVEHRFDVNEAAEEARFSLSHVFAEHEHVASPILGQSQDIWPTGALSAASEVLANEGVAI